jgi:lipid-A-disaccharide synthase
MKYYLISGEASGDLHGSNLMKALSQLDSQAEFRFWGGNLMEQVGGTLVKHYEDLAFMGFKEVILNLRTIIKNLNFCKKDILNFKPDVLILIDYPGFNLRIADFANKTGIQVHYYISPQIWAWKENRIHKIKKVVDEMYVILPFEKDFYEKKHDFPVHFVGHPLIDAIADEKPMDNKAFREEFQLSDKPIIALLPGSRRQEIRKMLGVMLQMAKLYTDYQFVIAGAPGLDVGFYHPFLTNENVKFVPNRTYELLSISYAAIVTSGTATLETALFKVPEIVCYKTSWLSYQIGKRLVKLEYISLVNLIMNREVVKELIQSEFTAANLEVELENILDIDRRVDMFMDYYELETLLGGKGASMQTASHIYTKKRPK